MIQMEDERVITVVSRSQSADGLISRLARRLYGGYGVTSCYPLGEPGIDGKERFIAFITIIGETEFEPDSQVDRLTTSTQTAKLHEDMQTALVYAQEQYGLDPSKADLQEKLAELEEEFPPLDATEVSLLTLFQVLFDKGYLSVVPGKLDGERVITLSFVSRGAKDVVVNPAVILVNDRIGRNLEVPRLGDD